MKIKTWRDPYDAGFNVTNPKEIELQSGLTVLVGCNGAGKTTLLMNIKSECKENKIPCHFYDNLQSGGNSSLSSLISGIQELPGDDIGLAMSIWNSSEGEAIKLNIGRQSTLYKEFLKTGYYKNRDYSLSKLFRSDNTDVEIETNIRVLLFDATDSGLSIDNVCELKDLFNTIIEEAEADGLELYIIISANEYELCRGEQCFDVNTGKYLTFKRYETYRNFILRSRKRKEKRIEKQIVWMRKQKQKELEQYIKVKETNEQKIKELKKKEQQNGKLSWSDKDRLHNLEREIMDFVRESRYLSEKDII